MGCVKRKSTVEQNEPWTGFILNRFQPVKMNRFMKVPLNKICRFRSSCACPKYHLGLCSPFIHSVVSNESVSWQWRPWLDWLAVQTDPSLRCPHYAWRHLLAWRYPFVADDIQKIFFIFQRKQVLIFHVNRLPSRRFIWNVKTFFLWKIQKKKKNNNLKILVCCSCDWRFKG